MTLLGSLLTARGIARWMPQFQRRPTPGFAATVLGMPLKLAEKIDRLEFEGNLRSAQWELDQWLKKGISG